MRSSHCGSKKVNVLVSLLTPEEIAELYLEEEDAL
jgi:hypothetical protein